jgi:cytochrome c oxidase assembly protein subunit 15
MDTLAKISLLLVIVLVSLSAYLRLAHSGIGCADWPECYGRIGEPPELSQPVAAGNAYEQLLISRSEPLSWATPTHRLVASVLGLAVFGLVILSLRNRRQRLISFALLALTVYLAVLGIRSGSLHDPAVVMGNLAGGFTMLGLLGWMVFSTGEPVDGSRPVRWFSMLAIALLSLQILLGGLTSANFAATSCQTLPDCHGSWLPGPAFKTAIDLSRQHQVTPSGQAIGGEERLAIHKAHRLGSILALLAVLLAAVVAFRAESRYRTAALLVLIFVSAEFLVGITSVLASLPIGLAVAHNWFAGLLMLALLKLLALSRRGKAGLG